MNSVSSSTVSTPFYSAICTFEPNRRARVGGCGGSPLGDQSSVLVAQSCLTLCSPIDCNPPGSSVHGILQARILEWVAIPFSGDPPDSGIEPESPTLHADSLPSEPPGKPPLVKWNLLLVTSMGFPGSSDGKASAYNVGDLGLIPGSGSSPGEGNDNPLQYSCLENPMDWGAW